MAQALPAAAPRGLGGWLRVPAASRILAAGGGLYAIADVVTSPEMLSVALFYQAWLTIDFVGTLVFWIGLPAVAIILQLMRSRRFPAAFDVTAAGIALFGFVEPFFLAVDLRVYSVTLLYSMIPGMWFLAWSWYMLASVRVKTTFVN